MPLGFRINETDQPFLPEKLAALPRAQQLLERALMREKFAARSVAELASESGLSEAEVIEYCDGSPHIARSPFQDAKGRMYYGLLVKLLTKYSLAPDGTLLERFDTLYAAPAAPEGGPVTPSAFISYSWDNDDHKGWVRVLAERLRADGVDVTLDRWSAVPGDQLPAFMEQAIRQNQFCVIGVCTSLPTTPHLVVGRSACRVGVGPSLNRSWAQRSRPVVQAGRRAFPGDESVVD